MSITTRDLKLRQKEVEKNLNETYSTLRKQPEGGLGAMIQKPNHFEPPIKRVPILFTPSPMLSSLPYLAEWVKYRSNEVEINTTLHLIRQRETAKASFIYDEIKQNDMDMRNDKVLETVGRNFTPSTADLLRKYLSNEIDKTRNEERKIQEQRMKRVDLAMNPVREEAPAGNPPLLRTLTSGDMGRPNVPDQAEIRTLRNEIYEKAKEAGRDYGTQTIEKAGRDYGTQTIEKAGRDYGTQTYGTQSIRRPRPAMATTGTNTDAFNAMATTGTQTARRENYGSGFLNILDKLKSPMPSSTGENLVASDAKDQAIKRKFTNLGEGLLATQNRISLDMVQQLRKFKEEEIGKKLKGSTASSLKLMAQSLEPNIPKIKIKAKIGQNIGEEIRQASDSELKKKLYSIPTIIEAKAKGTLKKIPFDVPLTPLVPTTGAGRPAGVGALRAEELGRVVKGVV